ncbi:WcaF family extracellular polysaccharide biosynthesis acetyltransferase [Cesiribacter sp. SM1]|uniref:WcaF family extracellular polysaccharide biosynthesis acetyltransferase n=1 Tax=Cesiribacter sp. SM1 TaxID=2861196 RepID=UPI001CD3FE26|nr:WcaF family extracellular polysaccharide biosynthesis acetyltransferase [Cesiribacter sp. SM1]
MNHQRVRLDLYDNSWYSPGAGNFKRILWYVINVVFFINPLNPVSSIKVSLLRLFGATIGEGVVIKPGVNIKYPWNLFVGNQVWIGEGVWIDNLVKVAIGDHVCISQGAMLLTGNHNYKSQTFDLVVSPIMLENGCWIGARSTVCPGVSCGTHSVLAVGSVATHNLEAWTIYQGNPAKAVRTRTVI